ncbi:MAG: GntR family transcriptional regulator [Faecousia sp.]
MAVLKSISLADQVFDKLETDIISGVYPRGEVLTELKLVEQLNVSRTPIREALRRLEQERLIRDSGKGSVVLGITLEDLEDIMDIRLRCEGLAAYYAAKNRTEEDARRLRQLSELQDFYFAKGDFDHLREIDDEFHESIYEISGRTVLMDTLRPLHRKTQRYRRNSMAARRQKSIDEHKAICDAICAGDANLAEKLVSQHIENAKITMIERFSQNG